MKDRLVEALRLIINELDDKQKSTVASVLRIYDEVSYMDYTDWEEYRKSDELKELLKDAFNLRR